MKIWSPLKKNFYSGFTVISLATLTISCASNPTANDPAWTHEASRTIDNGYIVYVESIGASDSNRGRFLAESQALMDIRNECTLIPKGSRIEDRYEKINSGVHEVYVKVGVEFQECEQAKRANSVEEIQKLANVPMTEEVKRLEDEQKSPTATQLAENEVDLPPNSSVNRGTVASNDSTHYYIVREQMAEDKQFVILNPVYYQAPVYAVAPPPPAPIAGAPAPPPPPTTPAMPGPHGPQLPPAGFDRESVNQRLSEHSQNVQQMEQAHPELKNQKQPWSQVRNNLVRNYKTNADRARKSGMQQPKPHTSSPPAQQKSGGRRRRRY